MNGNFLEAFLTLDLLDSPQLVRGLSPAPA